MCLSFLFTFRLSPNCGTIFILCSSPYKWKLFWKIWCFWFSEIKDCDTNQLDGEHHQHPYPSLPERRRSKQERRWSWGRGPHGKWNILKELLTANLKVHIHVNHSIFYGSRSVPILQTVIGLQSDPFHFPKLDRRSDPDQIQIQKFY